MYSYQHECRLHLITILDQLTLNLLREPQSVVQHAMRVRIRFF